MRIVWSCNPSGIAVGIFKSQRLANDDTPYARRVGSGLSDIDSGLRLRYEFSRKFAPYIGVTYQKWFGNTADIRQANGSPTRDFRATIGIRMWF